ncbi:MAG: phosphate ABC transporter permease PstA [Bacillota bacterium]|nr:phosphate ABC transporter permease PstA [Bacillota bacterium]
MTASRSQAVSLSGADDVNVRRRLARDRVLLRLPALATALVLVPLFSLLYYVMIKGFAALDWNLLTRLPGAITQPGGGMANGIVGSLIVTGLAVAVAIPAGVIAGVYLGEHGRGSLGDAIRFAAEVLSGVPSIAIGLFVYNLVVIRMGRFSALAGATALAIIMLPVVARTTEEMLRMVPASVREAGLALGIPPWKVILRIVLPAASTGILTGAMLGVARIAGETAPLLFTALNNNFWSAALGQPIATLPVQIFTFALTPYPHTQMRAWAGAAILISLVLLLNIVARLVLGRARGVPQ